jgi:hypothetical protein
MSIVFRDLFGGHLELPESKHSCICNVPGCGILHSRYTNPNLHRYLPHTPSGLMICPCPRHAYRRARKKKSEGYSIFQQWLPGMEPDGE